MSPTGYIYGEPWPHRHERRERAALSGIEKLALFTERCGGTFTQLLHKPKIIMDFGERGRATWKPRDARFLWSDKRCLSSAHIHTVDDVCNAIHRHLIRLRRMAA